MAFITSKCTYGGPLWIWFHNLALSNFCCWPPSNVSTVTDSSDNASTDWLIEHWTSAIDNRICCKNISALIFFPMATVANLSQFSHQCNWLINLGWGAIYFPWNKKKQQEIQNPGSIFREKYKVKYQWIRYELWIPISDISFLGITSRELKSILINLQSYGLNGWIGRV